MPEKIEKILKRLELLEPPGDLYFKIISRIEKEQYLRMRKIFLLKTLFSFLVSFGLSFISSYSLLNELESSGFFYFMKIALNDKEIFLSFFDNFFLAILESLPIFNILFFLMSSIIFVFVLRLFFEKVGRYSFYLNLGSNNKK